jgi:hypothetical protein
MALRHSCACIRCYAPQQPQPATTLLWRRGWSTSLPRVQRLWHDTRREAHDEKRPESVPAICGRFAPSRGVRAVGVVGGAQLTALSALLRHPDPLMTAAFAANTPRHIRGIGSVLEVDSTGSGQSGLQCCRPSLVDLGQSPHLVRCQSKISECRPERLTSVDRS